MSRYLEPETFQKRRTLPLGKATLLGRIDESIAQPPELGLAANTNAVFLASDDTSIQDLESAESGQLEIRLVSGEFFATDRNPASFSVRLNGSEFVRRKLILNDRINIGETFSFVFDGTALIRVQGDEIGEIKASHLSKTYRQRGLRGHKVVRAVEDANFVIEPGEFVGVIGPSGCGKSTLLNMLAGNLEPSAGKVAIDGVDIHATKGAVEDLVGSVPQDDIVHPELTVWDAVRMSADLRLRGGMPNAAKNSLCERVIVDLGLWLRRGNRVSELSGGQRKRVSVAVELLSDASVLFLDEPTSGLDPATERELMEQLHRLSCQGRTVVCTTHVLQRAYLFTKLCVMSKGVIVALGSLDAVMKQYGLTERDQLVDLYHLLGDSNRPAVPYDHAETPSRASAEQVRALLDPDDFPFGEEPIKYFTGGCVARVTPETFTEIAEEFVQNGAGLWGDVVVVFEGAPDGADEFYDTLIRLRPILQAKQATLRLVSAPMPLEQLIGAHRLNGVIRTYDAFGAALVDSELGSPIENAGGQSMFGIPMWALIAFSLIAFIGGATIICLLIFL